MHIHSLWSSDAIWCRCVLGGWIDISFPDDIQWLPPPISWWRHDMEPFPHYCLFVTESTGDQWIPLHMARNTKLWFCCCEPEKAVHNKQKADLSVISWWRHQMETFSAVLVICAGNSPVTDEFPTQRPVTRSFDVSLICAWMNGWANNRETGDLTRHRAHYDVTVMFTPHGLHVIWRWRNIHS